MDNVQAAPPKNIVLRIMPALGTLLYVAFLIWLYSPGLEVFFASDDWVILNHVKNISAGEPWRYFSLKSVWFYRPLQSLQYGFTYHLAGLHAVAYNIQLLIMHLAVCSLAWVLLRLMFSKGIAAVAVLLFSVSSVSPDVLLWKGNFNTLQNGIFTLAASISFYRFLTGRNKWWLLGSYLAAVLNCFSKESSVNLPIVLSAVWITFQLQRLWAGELSHPIFSRTSLFRAVRDLAGFAIIAVLYAGIHRAFFDNIEVRYIISYKFVSPLAAVGQWMQGTTRALSGIFHLPDLGKMSVFGFLVPAVVAGIALWLKNAPALFAVLFAMAMQVPTFALANFDENRYYYMPSLGGMLLVAAVAWPLIWSIANSDGYRRIAGYGALLVIMCIFAVNVVRFQERIGNIIILSRQVERAFGLMRLAKEEFPTNSLIVLQNASEDFFYNGFGATEMGWFATGRTEVFTLTETQRLPQDLKDRIYNRPHRYHLDLASTAKRITAF